MDKRYKIPLSWSRIQRKNPFGPRSPYWVFFKNFFAGFNSACVLKTREGWDSFPAASIRSTQMDQKLFTRWFRTKNSAYSKFNSSVLEMDMKFRKKYHPFIFSTHKLSRSSACNKSINGEAFTRLRIRKYMNICTMWKICFMTFKCSAMSLALNFVELMLRHSISSKQAKKNWASEINIHNATLCGMAWSFSRRSDACVSRCKMNEALKLELNKMWIEYFRRLFLSSTKLSNLTTQRFITSSSRWLYRSYFHIINTKRNDDDEKATKTRDSKECGERE